MNQKRQFPQEQLQHLRFDESAVSLKVEILPYWEDVEKREQQLPDPTFLIKTQERKKEI